MTSFPVENVSTIEGYHVVNLEVASSNTFETLKNSFRDGGGGEAAEANIDDSIKRKRFRVSLNNTTSAIIMRLV